MNTTNKQDETLEVAYSKHKEKYSHFMPDEQSESMLSFSFEEGAKWQKEQDKIIVDGILKRLEELKEGYDLMLQERDAVRKVSHDRKVTIDKLIEALGNTLSILEKERNYIGVSLYKSYAPYYDKAKELLQSLK